MKQINIFAILLPFLVLASASGARADCPQDLLHVRHEVAGAEESFTEGRAYPDASLKYSYTLNFADTTTRGKSFLYWSRILKTKLDYLATNGFQVVNGDQAVEAMEHMSAKVKRQAMKAVGGSEANLRTIADGLSRKGNLTFYQIPNAIRTIPGVVGRVDIYELQTFFGLASGGGVALRFYEGNWAFSVNYGTGAVEKDPQTGRSFGEGPGVRATDSNTRGPNDVSDKDHLQGLSESAKEDPANALELVRTISQTMMNSDTRNFAKLSPINQTLASDFFAVLHAEQHRRLMNKAFSLKWDQALAQITIIGIMQAKVEKMFVMYADRFHKIGTKFTDRVFNQYQDKSGKWVERDAEFYDYWQRSSQASDIDPATGKPKGDGRGTRSGINLTRQQFELLSREITTWMKKNHPELVYNISNLMHSAGNDVVTEWSEFLINKEAPDSFVAHADDNEGLAYSVTEALVAFVAQAQNDMPAIFESLKTKNFDVAYKPKSGRSWPGSRPIKSSKVKAQHLQ